MLEAEVLVVRLAAFVLDLRAAVFVPVLRFVVSGLVDVLDAAVLDAADFFAVVFAGFFAGFFIVVERCVTGPSVTESWAGLGLHFAWVLRMGAGEKRLCATDVAALGSRVGAMVT